MSQHAEDEIVSLRRERKMPISMMILVLQFQLIDELDSKV